ncbi:MAG: hypothetical protein JW700_00165 [Candidatus Aenigmarchaeota archaeon]|nr:hypothetical protein [Candidatus Aenigmarchaeota archaeon]
MTNVTLISIMLIAIGIVFVIQELSVKEEEKYEYSYTDYVEPEERFVACDDVDDCFKFKGSACPANMGGVEVCVNKNFVQEYNSVIESKTGLTLEIECPEINRTTDMTCACINNKCALLVI